MQAAQREAVSGPRREAAALSPPTAELCRASGPLPLLSLHDTARQVTPRHYFTEEETEAGRGQGMGPRPKEAGARRVALGRSKPEA